MPLLTVSWKAAMHVGKARFHLATRPLLPQHNCTAPIEANDVECVLANIDADYGDCGVEDLRHGVLLVFGAPCQLRSLAGREHGRTIPLGDIVALIIWQPRITHCMAGLEPVIHATAHNILDQGGGPRSNRLVVEVDVQVFGLH